MNSRTRPPEPRFRVLIGTDCRHLLDRPEPPPHWPGNCRFLPMGSDGDTLSTWYSTLRQEAVRQDAVFCLFPHRPAPNWTAGWHDQARYWAAAWSRRPFVIRCLTEVPLVEAAALAWLIRLQPLSSADAMLGSRNHGSPLHWQRRRGRLWSVHGAYSVRYSLGHRHLVRTILSWTNNRWPIWVGDQQGTIRLIWHRAALAHAVTSMPNGTVLYDESLNSSHSASPRALSCQIPRA